MIIKEKEVEHEWTKVEPNPSASDIQFVANLQAKVMELERALSDILIVLLNYKGVTVKHTYNRDVELIHSLILDYKKRILESKGGRDWLDKYSIDPLQSTNQ